MVKRDIIVIGGSAGSIKPLNTLLSRLPSSLQAVILVVVHVPAESPGIFNAVATGCPFPVWAAKDGQRANYGSVYIAPPGHHLLLANGLRLTLGSGPRENLARPSIDSLFRSAALTAGPRVIGVILSGMLNDGASGLAAIKNCKGIALVQSPAVAECSAMPLAALEVTPVDLSAAEAELAEAIVRYIGVDVDFVTDAPPELRLEVEIAAGKASTTATAEKLGHPVALTCPDCGGVLSEIDNAHPVRFRCQVGHAYTGKALLSEQQGAVDEAMRVALRIIEERAELVARMGREAEVSGRPNIAATYSNRASEYRAQADVLRDALLDLMSLTSDEPAENEIADFERRAVLQSEP